jgi:DNA-binding MarR family transcriptional regulator
VTRNDEAKLRFVRTWVRYATVTWQYGIHLHEAHGLSGPQFGILRVLEGRGPSSMSEIDPFFPGYRSALTQMADRLVQGGWVRRERDPGDRRRVVLHLTDRARQVLAGEKPLGPARVGRLMNEMSPEEAEGLADALDAVVHALIGDARVELPDDKILMWVLTAPKEN